MKPAMPTHNTSRFPSVLGRGVVVARPRKPRVYPSHKKEGARCACNRDRSGNSSLIRVTLYVRGELPRDVCDQCADEAPLGSILRKLGVPLHPVT